MKILLWYFAIPKFKIEAVSSSSFSVLTRYVHPLIMYNPNNWNLTFSVQNPNNNYDFYYNDFKANISYTDTLLWSGNVFDKFHQDAKDQSLIDSTFAALPEAYEYWIGTSIAGDFASGQTTRFSVSLSGIVQMSDRKSASHISCREVEVSCGGLRVENLQDSTQTGVLVVDSSKACVVISQDSTC
uniref:Late embryogenesis abundant protein LEA-2 subgroup domain-containing protein n=1 Tax=Solanum tuberosum TaxID=4113 RepID=M1DRA0_SOLTU